MTASVRAMTCFVRVVETKSFAAAARALLVDPAAVSRAIKALEDELGVLLFARSTRSLKLTADGILFHRDCMEILAKLEAATQRFRSGEALPHGQLKVGIAPSLTRRMLLRAIPSFQEKYPQLQLILLSVNDNAEIGDEGIDVLIRPRNLRQRGGQRTESQGVVVRRLTQSRAIACASPEYLDRIGVPRTPSDLLGHACVALLTLERDVHNTWQFARSGARQKIKFFPKLLVHGDALPAAGLAGCGIIRLLECHVEDELRSGRLVRVLPDWDCVGGPPIVAIYRKAKPTLPRVSAFVRHLAQNFRRYDAASFNAQP